MMISDIARLAQDIFPEISAHAWSISKTANTNLWCVGAEFNRTLRLEVILKHTEWAICQLVTTHDDDALSEEETERVVIDPTRDNFIGWFSDVRSRFPLPLDYILLRGDGDFDTRFEGNVFSVDSEYTSMEFHEDGWPKFPVTPQVLRTWLAAGQIVPFDQPSDPCRGCAVEYINCGMKVRHDSIANRDCYHLHNVPKARQPERPTDPPIEQVEKSLCDTCRLRQENVLGGDTCKVGGTLGDFACTSFKPEDKFKRVKKVSSPPRTCPQCVNFDTRTHHCKNGWPIGTAPHCGGFAWAGITGTGLRTSLPSGRDCRNCEHYSHGSCARDEALGTAPICSLYSDRGLDLEVPGGPEHG